MNERRVTLAAIAGAHGVHGALRLKLFCESPADLERYERFEAAGRTLTLAGIRLGPNGAIARFAEIADRAAAEALRGAELAVPRSALPPLAEGEYYRADLIGLAALSSEGKEHGCVVAVENFGAGDVIEIECPDGKRFMVPMRTAVTEWNDQRLVIDEAFVD